MAYQLEDGESLTDAVRRCAREELDTAVHQLTEGIQDDPVAAIHEARQALKKQRSLLRLARAAMGSSQRRQEAAVLRDAARKLSGTRDAEVMIEVLDGLAEHFTRTDPRLAFAAAREYVVARRDRERERASRSGTAAAVAIDLQAARRRVADWELRGNGWRAIADGLGRSYRRGRLAFKHARAEPSAENLHDWRKRAKDLWYHERWLRELSESTMRGHAAEAHRLSQLLGDNHDLWVLREALTAMTGGIPADLDSLIEAIDERRARLETEAFLLGERAYAERPAAFVRRVHRYWKAWRAETRTAASPGAVVGTRR
jgi:CHAD domain-containing protein